MISADFLYNSHFIDILGSKMFYIDESRDRITNEFKSVKDVYLGQGKHYLQEDHPDKIGIAIVEWFQALN